MAYQTVRSWDPELVPTPAGRGARPDEACPVEVALRVISGRWSTLLIRELLHGPLSYGAFRKRLPTLTDKVLTDRLAELRGHGIVERQITRGFPSRVTYQLTPRGEALRPLMIELYRTGEALLA
ncbi:winged helix-turn-helix transcriptional regulator [Actinopolymorpha alba]|uniref:winged helix-turn-helix transcriptional regulator n=1 Tax=Actinopolymorpha alba TaxID=533267 RepID=UPI0003803F95|nr:helix-turn-helix domain-containing protein [Actinopolymorpha alba]